MDWEERLRQGAEEHEGLVAKFHLEDLEVTSNEWWRAQRTGRWDTLSPRVLRLRGAPISDAQRALAAVLDAGPGAFLHGPSTLAWFELRGFDLRTVEVSRRRGGSNHPVVLGRLHRLRDVRPHDVLTSKGIDTETPLRAIWSEAARFSAPRRFEIGLERIGRLLDDAHREDLVRWTALHEMVDDIRQRGRAGTVLMRHLAADRRPGSSPTESRNEDRFEKIVADAGMRPFRRQVWVGGTAPIGRVDELDDQVPLVVEVNSMKFHTTPTDRRADRRRHAELTALGLTVCVVWDNDLWSRPPVVRATVIQARRLAKDHKAVVIHTPGCPWPAED